MATWKTTTISASRGGRAFLLSVRSSQAAMHSALSFLCSSSSKSAIPYDEEDRPNEVLLSVQDSREIPSTRCEEVTLGHDLFETLGVQHSRETSAVRESGEASAVQNPLEALSMIPGSSGNSLIRHSLVQPSIEAPPEALNLLTKTDEIVRNDTSYQSANTPASLMSPSSPGHGDIDGSSSSNEVKVISSESKGEGKGFNWQSNDERVSSASAVTSATEKTTEGATEAMEPAIGTATTLNLETMIEDATMEASLATNALDIQGDDLSSDDAARTFNDDLEHPNSKRLKLLSSSANLDSPAKKSSKRAVLFIRPLKALSGPSSPEGLFAGTIAIDDRWQQRDQENLLECIQIKASWDTTEDTEITISCIVLDRLSDLAVESSPKQFEAICLALSVPGVEQVIVSQGVETCVQSSATTAIRIPWAVGGTLSIPM